MPGSPYSGNKTAAESPSPAASIGGTPIALIPNDGDAANASSVMQPPKMSADWIAFLADIVKGFSPALYGTGIEGDLPYSADHDLDHELNANNLAINAGFFYANRFVVRVKDTLTVANGAMGVVDMGLDGGAPGTGTPGLLRNGAYSWLGHIGSPGVITAGTPGGYPTSCPLYAFGGKGGAGGAGYPGVAGGVGGISVLDHVDLGYNVTGTASYNNTTPAGAVQQDGWVDIYDRTHALSSRQFIVGGMGGGAGGCNDTGRSGGGGGGGGVLLVFARRVVVGATAGVPAGGGVYSPFCARGGAGGLPSASTANGGGGGGGGGRVIIVTSSWTGPALTSACVAGGAGGAAGVFTNGVGGNPGHFNVLLVA